MSFQKQAKFFKGKRKRSDSCKSCSLENLHVNKFLKTNHKSSQKYKATIFKKNNFNNNNNKGNNNSISYSSRGNKNVQSNDKILFPNQFWFGGNMRDPLNLNGLINHGEMSHSVTPMSSPPLLLTPHRNDFLVPVVQAANIYDPLNLCGVDDDEMFYKPKQRARKRRYLLKIKQKNKQNRDSIDSTNNSGMSDERMNDSTITEITTSDLSIHKNDPNKGNTPSKNITIGSTEGDSLVNDSTSENISYEQSDDISTPQNFKKPFPKSSEITSPITATTTPTQPVIPTERCDLINKKPEDPPIRVTKQKRRKSINLSISKNVVKYKAKNERYSQGNFNSFDTYKNDRHRDNRLDSLPKDKFLNKDILEIGCNVGYTSIIISRDFRAKKVLGVDIDEKLIKASRRNLNYFSNLDRPENDKNINSQLIYPEFCNKFFGPVSHHPLLDLDLRSGVVGFGDVTDFKEDAFPCNVDFKCENYVPSCQLEIDGQRPQYDVILAMGITKYIHLNYGDEGLKRTFLKAYNQLRPGGRFIMQAQRWSSYKRKKRMTEKMLATYKGLKFLPNTFKQYLTGPEVGFVGGVNWHPPGNNSNCHRKNKAFTQPLVEFIKPLQEAPRYNSNNNNNNNNNHKKNNNNNYQPIEMDDIVVGHVDKTDDDNVDNDFNDVGNTGATFCNDIATTTTTTPTLLGNASTDVFSTCCCCSSSRATYCSTCQNTPSHVIGYSQPSTPWMMNGSGIDDDVGIINDGGIGGTGIDGGSDGDGGFDSYCGDLPNTAGNHDNVENPILNIANDDNDDDNITGNDNDNKNRDGDNDGDDDDDGIIFAVKSSSQITIGDKSDDCITRGDDDKNDDNNDTNDESNVVDLSNNDDGNAHDDDVKDDDNNDNNNNDDVHDNDDDVVTRNNNNDDDDDDDDNDVTVSDDDDDDGAT